MAFPSRPPEKVSPSASTLSDTPPTVPSQARSQRGEKFVRRAHGQPAPALAPFFGLASIRFERWDHNTQIPFRPEVGLSNPPSHVAINDDKPPLSYLAHNHVVYTAMGSGA